MFRMGLAVLMCGVVSAVAAADDPRDAHVVIISLDGFPAYLLDDPKAPLPTIRKLAKSGAAAEGMRVSNPSVTWPNHTSLITGVRPEKHGVLANGMLVRGGVGAPVTVDPKRDKTDLVRVATLYDVVHAAKLTTADVNWPCTRGAKSLDDSFPDVPDAVVHSTPRLRRALVEAGILTDETDESFKSGSVVGRDHIWTEAACHLIRQRKPNLLLLHLLNVDSTHHSVGPKSPPGYTAVAYADQCVRRVLDALDEAGIRERTTVFVLADHGFTLTPKALKPNLLLKQQGLLKSSRAGKIDEARVQVIPEGGVGLVYLTDPSFAEEDRRRVHEIFDKQEGIEEVLEPVGYAAHGLPHPRGYAQMSDLVLVAKDGYGFSASAEGDAFVALQKDAGVSLGSHGFLATNPKMNALFVVAGRGIKGGSKLGVIENIDIAPTAARLLGQTMGEVDGRVLSTVLVEEGGVK